MKARCSGCSSSGVPRPSTVLIFLPCAWTANIRQDRTASLSRMTVQVPQTPCSQPMCVPVCPQSSRMASTSVLRGSTRMAWLRPLTLSVIWTLSVKDQYSLFGLGLLVARRLLRGLKLLHSFLQTGHVVFERHDLGFHRLELLPRLDCILHQKALQEVDVALKTPGSLVQPRRFRAVLYSRNILRAPGIDSGSDQAQAQEYDSHHCTSS